MKDYEFDSVVGKMNEDGVYEPSFIENLVEAKNHGKRSKIIGTLVSVLGFPFIGLASIGLGVIAGAYYYGCFVIDEEDRAYLDEGRIPLSVFDDCF